MNTTGVLRSNAPVRIPRGFTLVEILTALTIGSLLLIGGYQIVLEYGTATSSMSSGWLRHQRSVNARRDLAELVLQMEPRAASVAGRTDTLSGPLVGSSEEATFATQCLVAGGWRERCTIRIKIWYQQSATSESFRPREKFTGSLWHLIVSSDLGRSDTLTTSSLPILIRYLATAEGGGEWSREWHNVLRLPLGLGVINGADTMFFSIGAVSE